MNTILWLLVIGVWAMSIYYLIDSIRKRRSLKTSWFNATYRNEIHTLPFKDSIEHTAEDCACSPTEEPVEREDGVINWLVIHNALDGRKS